MLRPFAALVRGCHMMRVEKLLRVSVLVADLGRALEFYQEILGLSLDPTRPEFGFPGA